MFNVTALAGDDVLAGLTYNRARRYKLPGRVSARVQYGHKDILVATKPRFLTDMRSGPGFIDILVPHLGTQAERRAWWLHDVLSYDVGFSFDEVNDILKMYLISECGYSHLVANLVKFAVSRSHDWFGKPAQDSIYYPNLSLIECI